MGRPNIFKCKNCNLGFVYPEPNSESISLYYKSIYRSLGRPHYAHPKFQHSPTARHYAALNAVLPVIYANRIKRKSCSKIKILEIGAGWGEIGQLASSLATNLEITTIEPCVETQHSLLDNGYRVVSKIDELNNEEFDAIIALHVLEHFSNPNIFFDLFNKKVSSGAVLFLEMPNCLMNETFRRRPYDSPHLTFWNTSAISQLAQEFN